MRHAAALAAAALLLVGCGFTPIYAERTGVNADLTSIRVESGRGRAAYLVRQEVLDRLGARGVGASAEYLLQVDVSESRAGFGIRLDDVATRYELRVNSRYALYRTDDDTLVTRGQVVGTSSYDVSTEPFTDIAVEERARARAAALAADRLRAELSFFFADQNRP